MDGWSNDGWLNGRLMNGWLKRVHGCVDGWVMNDRWVGRQTNK